MREWGKRGKKRPSDSHEGLCTKTPDAVPSHASEFSAKNHPLLFFAILLSFLFLSFRRAALGSGGRVCASQQQRKRERKRERQGDTDIQLGEGLREIGAGLIWIKASDWLSGGKKKHVASCQRYSTVDHFGSPYTDIYTVSILSLSAPSSEMTRHKKYIYSRWIYRDSENNVEDFRCAKSLKVTAMFSDISNVKDYMGCTVQSIWSNNIK